MAKETVSTHLASKAKAKANEIVTTADRQGTTREIAPTHRRAKAKAKDSKENVTTAVNIVIPQGNARKEERQKEKATVTKAKAKDRGVGVKESGKKTGGSLKETGSGSKRRRKNPLGASSRSERREPTSTKAAARRSEGQGPRTIGQYMPEIFAVNAEKSGDSKEHFLC